MTDKQRGVTAVNQEFRRYEQVDKAQSYHLSESADEEFDDSFSIQVCDMSLLRGDAADRDRFVQVLGSALQEIGFAILTDHGVPTDLFEQTEANVIDFFESVPESERMPYLAKRHGSVNQGYFPMEETTIIHPDRVEGWVFCRRAFDLDYRPDYDERAFWPDSGYEPRFREVVCANEQLILPIMQSLLAYLGEDRHLYDERLTRTNFGFRLNYYPPVDENASGGGRMLGHEDVDLFTLLPAPSVEGLQVLNRQTMRWIRLQAPPGSIILNTGDYIQRITNDVLPSTTHRVARPRDPDAQHRPRVSFPMAVYLWEDELLEGLPALGTPKYPPIRAETFHTRITSKYYGDDYAAD